MLDINKQLYYYLIKELGAYYEQHTNEVKSNLNNSPEDNKWYLGTYFPKSFKESYTIFSDILQFFNNYDIFNNNEINILDLGSGTGGQLFGLLHVLSNKINRNLKINIYSIDGNENALEIQKNIFKNYWIYRYTEQDIKIKFIHYAFKNGDDIKKLLINNIEENSIDIFLSFKFLSEVLKNDNKVYRKTLKASENILKENGILILDDVCMPIATYGEMYEKFIPYTINENIKEYLNSEHSLNLLLPLCCFYNAKQCKKSNCYAQCSIYSNMIIDNNTYSKQVECKIMYNLFTKNGIMHENIQSFLQNVSTICLNFCAFKDNSKTCYCNCNDKFKEYFSTTNFSNSQFSLVKLNEIYKEYNDKINIDLEFL